MKKRGRGRPATGVTKLGRIHAKIDIALHRDMIATIRTMKRLRLRDKKFVKTNFLEEAVREKVERVRLIVGEPPEEKKSN